MSITSYEKLRERVSKNLNERKKGLAKTAGYISSNFKTLGLEIEVWCPEKVHTVNLGGIEAERYIGYAQIDGTWGLAVRTIYRDAETRTHTRELVHTLESCGDTEILAGAFEKIRDLVLCIHAASEKQIQVCVNLDMGVTYLGNPDCEF